MEASICTTLIASLIWQGKALGGCLVGVCDVCSGPVVDALLHNDVCRAIACKFISLDSILFQNSVALRFLTHVGKNCRRPKIAF